LLQISSVDTNAKGKMYSAEQKLLFSTIISTKQRELYTTKHAVGL